MQEPLTLRMHGDAGHAWLEVPVAFLEELCVSSQVSSDSYRNETTAFLEEDLDAGLVLRALNARETPYIIDYRYQPGESFIRQLERFRPAG